MLHTIGGDDTNTTAADLAAFLARNDYALTVVGLPKTIDNDVIPIQQSLGAWTAAEQGARFAQNIIGEHNSGSRMLIVHEVMGRHCGWLTAATAQAYRDWLDTREWLPEIGLSREAWDVHGVYVPEAVFDLEAEAGRLQEVMDRVGSVNLFISEGAGLDTIVAELERLRRGGGPGPVRPRQDRQDQPRRLVRQQVRRAARRREGDGAEVGLLLPLRRRQRARPGPDPVDDRPRRRLRAPRRAGVIGHDEERGDELRAIEFERIKGGKPFDISQPTGSASCWPASASPRPARRSLARAGRQRDQPRRRTALATSQASAAPGRLRSRRR